MDKKIFTVLLFSLVTRVIYLFFDKNIWWDAAVYLAMGEHIATFGQLGFWEPIRPLLWPFLLSYAFLFELNPIILGHIFSTFFSLGVIYLTYFIAKKLFNEQTALLSSILLSFTWIFFLFNARLYTEIPAVFFGLCAYYFFLQEKHFETGLCIGLAFLTKFPMGILLVILGLFSIRKIKNTFYLLAGFILITVPYFMFNYLAYGSPIEILFFAQEFLKYAGIWIFQEPWWWYLFALIKENVLFFFAIPGTVFAIYKKRYSLVAIFLLILIYLSQMDHKELRFTILLLPFIAIIAAYGYQKIFKENFSFIVIVFLLFSIPLSVEDPITNEYFKYFEEKQTTGEILVTHPLTGYYAHKNVTIMYYPWFNASQADYWKDYIEKKNPEYISLDSCEGGFLCPPDDDHCEEKKQELIKEIEEKYTTVFNETRGVCTYQIYQFNFSFSSQTQNTSDRNILL